VTKEMIECRQVTFWKSGQRHQPGRHGARRDAGRRAAVPRSVEHPPTPRHICRGI